MATFGLVHGGCHGAWQWGQLVAELDARGHESLCVDLPITDPALGVVDYAESTARAFGEHPDLIVVGHSMGGYVIPFVTELIPVRTLVFLTATIQAGALPGLPPAEQMMTIALEAMPVDDEGLIQMSAQAAAEYFYHDLSPSMRSWATAQLRPQSARAVMPERRPRIDPRATVASIVCREDHAVSPAWSRAAARDALRVEPYELAGSHSPFLTRPGELADVLHSIAQSSLSR